MLELKKHIQTELHIQMELQMQVVASKSPLGWALVRRYTRAGADVQMCKLRCISSVLNEKGVQVYRCAYVLMCK